VGTNIVVFGYGRSTGDVAFDPSLPITDASATINAASAGYFRSIDLLGRSANVSVALPYVWGSLQGNVAGQFQQVRRSGLGDPLVRFAVNLHGAPAMNLKEFGAYHQKTIIGASVVVVAPPLEAVLAAVACVSEVFVAVPAVWAFNYFNGKVEGFNVEMDNSSSELLDYFIKKSA
jgi:hypothetical protein